MINHIKGILRLFGLACNTLLFAPLAILLGVFLAPCASLKKRVLHGLYLCWVRINGYLCFSLPIDMAQKPLLSKEKPAILICNHQSWADILLLHHVFARQLPHMKFVMKASLQWVPLIGLFCRQMGYVFVKRIDAKQLRKKPSLKGYDLKQIKDAAMLCKRQEHVASFVLFPEGTRFTQEKHTKQKSPWTYLLHPHVSGITAICESWHDVEVQIIDVGIRYQGESISLWSLLSGDIQRVFMDVSVLKKPKDLSKMGMRSWMHARWDKKQKWMSS